MTHRVQLRTPDEASQLLAPEKRVAVRGYTAEQVAAMYQTPKSTIVGLLRSGAIPGALVGAKWRILVSQLPEVDAYFARQAEERREAKGTADRPAAAPRRRTPTTPAAPGVVQLRARPPRRAAANGTP